MFDDSLNFVRFSFCRCSITVQPCGDSVCQLRIELQDLSLAPPNGDGICNTDFLMVNGGASVVPILCGENSGQHIVVDFLGTKNPITLTIRATAAYTFGRHWHIRLTQINCDSQYRGKEKKKEKENTGAHWIDPKFLALLSLMMLK